MGSKPKDLTGRRFGRLVVIKDSGERANRRVKWLCRCDCGNEIKVRGSSLIEGNTKSCGCLSLEASEDNMKKIHEESDVEGTSVNRINGKAPVTNTSGEKGVHFVKKSSKWIARIGFKGERIYLGYFSSKQDAINARKEAEEKYFKPILEKYGKLSE